jgi:hypothetical protein
MFQLNYSNYNFIFTLYLLIAVNCLLPVLGCKLHNLLINNIYLKHVVGLFTLIVFVGLAKNETSTDEYLFFKTLLSSIFIYIIFMLSTKLNSGTFFIFIGLICCNFLVINYINSLDPIKFKSKIEMLVKVSDIVATISIIVLIIGFVIYYNKKQTEYGKKFKYITFLFGKQHCNK